MPTLPEHLTLLDAMDRPSVEAAQVLANLKEDQLRHLVESQGLTWNPERLVRSQIMAQVQAARPPEGKWRTRLHAIEDGIARHHAACKLAFMAAVPGLLLWASAANIALRGWPELWPILLIVPCMPWLARVSMGKNAEEFRRQLDEARNLVPAIRLPSPAC